MPDGFAMGGMSRARDVGHSKHNTGTLALAGVVKALPISARTIASLYSKMLIAGLSINESLVTKTCSNARLAEFGEVIHFKIPNTKLTPGTFEDLWDKGLWLGFDMRSGEHLIGTNV